MIFLVGMPGVGKTYRGRKVASRYGWHFCDTDHFIEEHEKRSIISLFETDGETAFRKKEHQYLARIIDSFPINTVIACGGGTPCFHRNMGMMKQAGKVVYLKAEIDYLLHNIRNDDSTRPILQRQDDLPLFLTALLKERSIFYEQAHYILQSENISLTTFDQIIF